MDTIATIIVTAFINIAITGIVSNLIFYRYQKRIEGEFARQKYIYETKLSKGYAKTVEILDNVYRKSRVLADAMFGLTALLATTQVQGTPIEEQNYRQIMHEIADRLKEIHKYLEENQLYLPTSITKEIRNIFQEVGEIYVVITHINIETLGKDGYREIITLIEKLSKIHDLVGKLENLYRSVTDVDYSEQ
jgi:hypothetical protein